MRGKKRKNVFETFVSKKRKKNSRTDTWENPHLHGAERKKRPEKQSERMWSLLCPREHHSQQHQIPLATDSEWWTRLIQVSPSLKVLSLTKEAWLLLPLPSLVWANPAHYWKQSSYLLSKCSISQTVHCLVDLFFIRQA